MTTLHEQIHKETRSVKLSRSERQKMHQALRAHMHTGKEVHGGFLWMAQVRFMVPAFAVLALMLGSSASYAAESALPGDTLYPIKVLVNEEVRAVAARSSEAKADWNVTRAERRLEEAATLAVRGELSPALEEELVARFEEHTVVVSGYLDALEEESASRAVAASFELEDSIAAHEEVLFRAGERNASVREAAEDFVSRVREASASLRHRTLAFEEGGERALEISATMAMTAPETQEVSLDEETFSAKGAPVAPEHVDEGEMREAELSAPEISTSDESYRMLAEQMKVSVQKRLKRAEALAESAAEPSGNADVSLIETLDALTRARALVERGATALEQDLFKDAFSAYREALTLLVRAETRLKLERSGRTWKFMPGGSEQDGLEEDLLREEDEDEKRSYSGDGRSQGSGDSRLDGQRASAGDAREKEKDDEDERDGESEREESERR